VHGDGNGWGKLLRVAKLPRHDLIYSALGSLNSALHAANTQCSACGAERAMKLEWRCVGNGT